MRALRAVLWLFVAAVAAATTGPTLAQPERIELEFERRPLAEIVSQIGRATGMSLVYDDTLRGSLTLAVPQSATHEEAIALLETALLMAGFVALPIEGGVRRILPVAEAAANAPWLGDGWLAAGDSPIATLLRLEAADVETVSGKLAHLVSKQDAVVPYVPTNSLILVGSERRVRRLIGLAQLIDRAAEALIAIHPLRYRSVGEVLALARGALQLSDGFEVWADERTNRLIARGSSDDLFELSELVAQLDRPAVTRGALEVLPLLHREATEIAEMLRTLAEGGQAAPGGSRELAAAVSPEALVNRDFIVVSEPHTGGLLLQADPATRAVVRDVVRELDRPARQVLVEMSLIEVSKPSTFAFGFDFFLPLLAPESASDAVVTLFSNPSGGGIRGMPGSDITFFGRVAREPLVLSVVDPESGLPLSVLVPREQATIVAVDRTLRVEVQSRPSLVLLEGEEHELFVGDNIPIPVSNTSAAAIGVAGLATSQTIERYDSGMTMRVRPTLGGEGTIQLETHFELSTVTESLAGDVTQVGPTLAKRTINATVRLRDGEIAVLGMGQDQIEAKSDRGVAFLRSIPLVGFLFRARRTEIRDRQILVTIEARLLEDRVESQRERLRLELGFARERARAPGIEIPEEHLYALRVGGARSEREAKLRFRALVDAGFDPAITTWTWEGEAQFDLYLGSYASIVDVGRAQARAGALGLRAELVLARDADRSPGGAGRGLAETTAAAFGRRTP